VPSDLIKAAFSFRALLTDTLPYEVPVIFSNDKLFRSMGREVSDPDLSKALAAINAPSDQFTIPYSYTIRKSRSNLTTLSIVHPASQQRIAAFYSKHEQSILASCAISDFTLRRPKDVAQKYAEIVLLDERSVLKTGLVEQEVGEGEAEISHIVSYFSYQRYNLLGKFIESREFIDLEKRFVRLRTLDVSKCFFNIYTHSITWAVKEKLFAKKNVNTYSFEDEFDRLMQRANYNETNGIVIGPEVSRIFAEIILQAIDNALKNELADSGVAYDQDYVIRRYVDDYFVFANKDDVIDRVESTLKWELEKFKLFLNVGKSDTVGRPFVSNLSQARSELREVVSSLWSVFGEDDIIVVDVIRRKRRWLSKTIQQIRLIVANYDIEFGNISGWLLSAFRNLIRKVAVALRKDPADGDADVIVGFLGEILRACFYVCALDLRVRSTYSLCQIVILVQDMKGKMDDESHQELLNYMTSELVDLVEITAAKIEWERSPDPVELYNLLICGSHFLGLDFVQMSAVSTILRRITLASRLSYFGYVSAKFCLMVDASQKTAREELNQRAKDLLLEGSRQVGRDAELYLLMCDFLASSDVSYTDRRAVFSACVGGKIANVTLAALEAHVGFADLSGMHVKHLLKRKELRPVYS